MDAIADAEQDALAALAETRASTLAGVELKLAALTRRADASQGFLSESNWTCSARSWTTCAASTGRWPSLHDDGPSAEYSAGH
jgi:hypothetical protein